MSRIRGRDTTPELAFGRHLAACRIPHVKHPPIPGSPDFVIPPAGLAIFIHGCFWHGCPRHFRPPKSNRRFWSAKIRRNMDRDERNAARLRRAGYSVFKIWEHDLRSPP
jgi:DNA mismatch endonuclease (patch repair protein)